MKLHELNKGDWIQFRLTKNTQSYIGEVLNFISPFDEDKIRVLIGLEDGRRVQINDGIDFCVINGFFDKNIENENEKEVPEHYTGGDVDLIEYFYQQRGLDAMVVMTSFNIQRYASRLGRKDEMVSELNKIIDYAQRLKEKLE